MSSATSEGGKSSSSASAQSCRRFSLAEIQSATKNFDDELVLGQGGYGKVYKGCVSMEEISHFIAIKRLYHMFDQGEPEFRAEIEMLSKLRHDNLVSLIGYCDDNREMILVYKYMPNGTLYNHVHNADSHLNWVQRLKIAICAGHGLDYLHKFGDDMNQGIIHRDVKSSNILLDENWVAMIADFGLSKICPIDRSFYASVRGTFGYLDPEYFYTRKLTSKTDVYAFGVLLFELLSGRLAVDTSRGEEECSLVRWAQKCVKERKLDQMIDPNMRGTISSKCLRRFAQIADRCLLRIPKERPNMTEVVASLEALLELQEKWGASSSSSSTSGFTRMIYSYLVSSTRENHDQSQTSSPTNPENHIQWDPSTNKEILARDLKIFTFEELRCATRGFAKDTFLGARNYAEVYKGWVDKKTYSPSEDNIGMPVVIKSICWNRTFDLEKAKLEVEVLKDFTHLNLVKLIGYCLLDKQLLLVNEFMPNGNFEHHLFSGTIARLPLVTKVKIALGIARGVVFLHNARDYMTAYSHWGGTSSMFRLQRRKILFDEDFTAKLSGYEVTKLAHGHYPYNVRDDNGLVYGDYYPSFKPLQLQSNLDGFTVILAEVLTGKQISYENEVQKIDDFLLQHGKISLRHIAKTCFEICNDVDSEFKLVALLEDYMFQNGAFAAATTESCLTRGKSCRV